MTPGVPGRCNGQEPWRKDWRTPRPGSGGPDVADDDDIGHRNVDHRPGPGAEQVADHVEHESARCVRLCGKVELSSHVDVEAEPEVLVEASRQVEREVAAAFPDGTVRVRFLLDGPARQPRTRRTTAIAVQE